MHSVCDSKEGCYQPGGGRTTSFLQHSPLNQPTGSAKRLAFARQLPSCPAQHRLSHRSVSWPQNHRLHVTEAEGLQSKYLTASILVKGSIHVEAIIHIAWPRICVAGSWMLFPGPARSASAPQDAHMEELEQLNFLLESTKEALAGQQATAATQAKQVEELTAQLADMHKQMGERDAVQGMEGGAVKGHVRCRIWRHSWRTCTSRSANVMLCKV
eukprot:1157512-Pelagomonas_calceolata.AAC.10